MRLNKELIFETIVKSFLHNGLHLNKVILSPSQIDDIEVTDWPKFAPISRT